jgi:hypothetical protein
VDRIIALRDRWVKAGPPPLGASLARWWDTRLVELNQAIRLTSDPGPMVSLADGREVPQKCLDALGELDNRWPGATFAGARGAIVAEVLSALGYYEETK